MTRYSSIAQAFHWLTVPAILCAVPLGVAMLRVEGPVQTQLFDLHRSFGALVLALTALRLAWRATHPPPPLPDGLPAWQRRASRLVHHALYALLFATPLVGWAATSAYRAPIGVFGLFFLPPIVAEDRALSEKLFTLHMALAVALCVLFIAHIGAALYHCFVRHDTVLARMWPGSAGRKT